MCIRDRSELTLDLGLRGHVLMCCVDVTQKLTEGHLPVLRHQLGNQVPKLSGGVKPQSLRNGRSVLAETEGRWARTLRAASGVVQIDLVNITRRFDIVLVGHG